MAKERTDQDYHNIVLVTLKLCSGETVVGELVDYKIESRETIEIDYQINRPALIQRIASDMGMTYMITPWLGMVRTDPIWISHRDIIAVVPPTDHDIMSKYNYITYMDTSDEYNDEVHREWLEWFQSRNTESEDNKPTKAPDSIVVPFTGNYKGSDDAKE